MKRLFICLFILISICLIEPVYANMAAPAYSEIGSSVTFEKNDDISVLSEVLDIVIDGTQAKITATYTMKNVTETMVTTNSMFVSPNIENNNTQIFVDDLLVDFEYESYSLSYDTIVTTDDWKYVVLTESEVLENDVSTVDTVIFEMQFEANEQQDIVISYVYNLGGYPNYDTDEKRGELYYYLAPANLWNEFSSLTINLTLDEDMPYITESSLEFSKISDLKYQYKSSTLPDVNLDITMRKNSLQQLNNSFSDSFLFDIPICVYIIFLVLVIIVIARLILKRSNSRIN
ncbi:MAG: hypothetical protein R3Y21_00070 [Mycoplasmatota bacterium]